MQMLLDKLMAEVAMLKQQLLENGITPNLIVPKRARGAAAAELLSVPAVNLNSTAASSTQVEKSQDVIEESKEPAMTVSSQNKDVSFNTLLDDSELSFNPDTSATSESAMKSAAVEDQQPTKPA